MLKSTFLFVAVLYVVIATPAFANEQLMEKSGCISCHRVDKKLIGPAFKAVAQRYKNNAEAPALLFEKVREGGEGEWDDIPMVPNSVAKISDADLNTVIEWILSL